MSETSPPDQDAEEVSQSPPNHKEKEKDKDKDKECHTEESHRPQKGKSQRSGLGNGIGRKDSMYTKIFVGGLPYATGDEGLRKHFEQYGDIEEAVVIRDRQTGKSRGYGFVTMKAKEAAQLAVATPNPIIDGRKANVNLAYLGAKPKGSQLNAAPLQAAFNSYRMQPLVPHTLLPPYYITNPMGAPFGPFGPFITTVPTNGNQTTYAITEGDHSASALASASASHINDAVFMPTLAAMYSSGMLGSAAHLQSSAQPSLLHPQMQQPAPRYLSAHNRAA